MFENNGTTLLQSTANVSEKSILSVRMRAVGIFDHAGWAENPEFNMLVCSEILAWIIMGFFYSTTYIYHYFR